MNQLRILYVTNNHPDLWVGGCEVYSLELYRAMRDCGEVKPFLLARSTAPGHSLPRETPFRGINEDPCQLAWTVDDYDHFFMTAPDKAQYTVHFRGLLDELRPDVVHVQHTIGLGVDLLRQIRTTLPEAPIVYTLHEFLPICFADGLMIRRSDRELCSGASAEKCHRCFPHFTPQQFFLRERFIKGHFALVDRFLAPSRCVLDRFLDWGIPAEKIQLQEYGRLPRVESIREADEENDGLPPFGHIGFFGQITRHKGILVLLEAMKILKQKGTEGVHLFINGANLEAEDDAVRQEIIAGIEECKGYITFRGRYDAASLGKRMQEVAWVVVPSIWWENSPLVIQEAFMHGRPVICSDIGGMAEKVTAGKDGLHFPVGNADELAKVLQMATSSPRLWHRLAAGIAPVYPMDQAVEDHLALYRSLVDRKPYMVSVS